MAFSFASCELWKSLDYLPQLEIVDDKIALHLLCRRTRGMDGTTISRVRILHLDFKYVTSQKQVDVKAFCKVFNYLMISAILNLELQAPFTFSVYSRRLLTSNYYYLKIYHSLLSLDSHINHHLICLQRICVNDYNVLRVLKKYSKISKKSIPCHLFSIQALNYETIKSSLAN